MHARLEDRTAVAELILNVLRGWREHGHQPALRQIPEVADQRRVLKIREQGFPALGMRQELSRHELPLEIVVRDDFRALAGLQTASAQLEPSIDERRGLANPSPPRRGRLPFGRALASPRQLTRSEEH